MIPETWEVGDVIEMSQLELSRLQSLILYTLTSCDLCSYQHLLAIRSFSDES